MFNAWRHEHYKQRSGADYTMVNSVVGLTELKGNYVDCRLLQLLLHESDVKKAVDFFVANVVDITWTLSLILMVR